MAELAALAQETALVGKEREIRTILEYDTAITQETISQESFIVYTDLL